MQSDDLIEKQANEEAKFTDSPSGDAVCTDAF
jgi:hypothetical protein